MDKKRVSWSLIIFTLFVVVYFFVLKPMFEKSEPLIDRVDNFDIMDGDFWYIGSMSDNRELRGYAEFYNGIFTLRKTASGENLYLLSKPIPAGKKQILTVKRRLKIKPDSDYFSGGLVLFQTQSKTRIVDQTAKNPFGSAIGMVEYVLDPKNSGTRPGTRNIRVLSPDWNTTNSYELFEPVFNKWFEEKLTYNCYTGIIEYSIDDGEKKSVQAPVIVDSNIRVWMHAYGNSKTQQIEIDKVEIKIENLEEEALKENESDEQ